MQRGKQKKNTKGACSVNSHANLLILHQHPVKVNYSQSQDGTIKTFTALQIRIVFHLFRQDRAAEICYASILPQRHPCRQRADRRRHFVRCRTLDFKFFSGAERADFANVPFAQRGLGKIGR